MCPCTARIWRTRSTTGTSRCRAASVLPCPAILSPTAWCSTGDISDRPQGRMSQAATLTLSRLLVDAVRRHGERPALRHGLRTLSYRELDELSDRLATTLASRGIGRGDRVAL